jgi:hypothetical protein
MAWQRWRLRGPGQDGDEKRLLLVQPEFLDLNALDVTPRHRHVHVRGAAPRTSELLDLAEMIFDERADVARLRIPKPLGDVDEVGPMVPLPPTSVRPRMPRPSLWPAPHPPPSSLASAPPSSPPTKARSHTMRAAELARDASLEVMAREPPPTDPRIYPPRVPDIMGTV